MRILITGAGGQLGKEFTARLSHDNEVLPLSHSQLPLENFQALKERIESFKPDLVINCAAYNKVDQAEEDWESAFTVNARGPLNLAILSQEYKFKLLHFSTDYVFDGEKGDLYEESDPPNPLNQYGRSKLLGERWVMEVAPSSLIFRVSWVYGMGRSNFIYKLLRWAERNEVLRISYDEFSVPTWTGFIVEKSLKALELGLEGIFHLVPSGFTSRFGYAQVILENLGIKKKVIPVSSSTFNLKAKRPFLSAMSSEKLQGILGESFEHWEVYLRKFLRENDLRKL